MKTKKQYTTYVKFLLRYYHRDSIDIRYKPGTTHRYESVYSNYAYEAIFRDSDVLHWSTNGARIEYMLHTIIPVIKSICGKGYFR